jgi:hypothetical protein
MAGMEKGKPKSAEPPVLAPGKLWEQQVANAYRILRAKVVENKSLNGNQIDVYIEESTPSGFVARTAVECKDHGRPVGKGFVNDFGATAKALRSAGVIDCARMVSRLGFTGDAQHAAEALGVELESGVDLATRLRERSLRIVVESESSSIKLAIDALNDLHLTLGGSGLEVVSDIEEVEE